MKYAIFGSTGFIGQHLVSYLRDRGEDVLEISRSGKSDSIPVDITNKEEFTKIKFSPDIIINCASRTPVKGKTSQDPDFLKEIFLTNIIGAINIANWAINVKAKKLINCSTLAVVNKPWPDPLLENHVDIPNGYHVGYSMSKLSQEQILNEALKDTSVELIHARLSAIYGLGMVEEGLIYSLLGNLIQDKDVVLFDAHKNTLDLLHVRDVSEILFHLSQSKDRHNVVNVARGKQISVFILAEVLKKLSKSSSRLVDKETSNLPSKSNVSTLLLKEVLRNKKRDFISIQDGLEEIVQHFLDKKELDFN
ncbi:NAD-dependent epimerase/dehydratase family protein [Salinimicrobium oceani]|uniref:NAD(P)-dependent oxidoreductase n=1 Tax=Salinimicrobium oceani TaxID=2722702 RepID=A0ABX1CYS2_9FLAO|nr:NAD(P)-dependent oxidoreductase [Salinimicrobium oceani]NJW53418.1 NAD(P)-dependent oxidoreductase [Salinimicrobium oceani]